MCCFSNFSTVDTKFKSSNKLNKILQITTLSYYLLLFCQDSFDSGVRIIQKRQNLRLYLFVTAIFNHHDVMVEAIEGCKELGLLTLKHYHYCQNKQWLALGRLLQIIA